jgi:hypothetical protein
MTARNYIATFADGTYCRRTSFEGRPLAYAFRCSWNRQDHVGFTNRREKAEATVRQWKASLRALGVTAQTEIADAFEESCP